MPDAEFSVKKLLDYLSTNLYQGERIEIRGFGSFCLHSHHSRIARNPKTGEKVFVNEKKSILFKMSKEWANKINEKE